MRYLVALPLSEPALSAALSLQHELQPASWHQTVKPHITLLAPDKPLMEPEEAASAFLAIKLVTPALTILADEIQLFSRHHRHTLVIKARPETALSDLFRNIVTSASWQDTGASTKRPFVPHITLANGLDDEQLRIARTKLGQTNPQLQFGATAIVLYAKKNSWPEWQELARLPLSSHTT